MSEARPSSIRVVAAIRDCGLPGHLKFLLMTLATRGDAEGGRIYPAVATTAGDVDVSERAVQINLRELERLGVLKRERSSQGRGGRGRTTQYRINLKSRHLRKRKPRNPLHPLQQRVKPISQKGEVRDAETPKPTSPDLPVTYPDLPFPAHAAAPVGATARGELGTSVRLDVSINAAGAAAGPLTAAGASPREVRKAG